MSKSLFGKQPSRRLPYALVAATLSMNLNTLALAQSVPVSNGSANLNLTSTSRTVSAGQTLGSGSVNIKTGGSVMNVTGQTLLTPAEHLAVMQVASGGSQTLLVGSAGNAVGGTFQLSPVFNNFSNLVIPAGVKSFSSATNLNVTGDLTNSGVLHFNTAMNVAASINANNIINNLGGVISSNSALNLIAANNIVNQGHIVSGGSLSFAAGNAIFNSSTTGVTSGIINAASDVNLNAANLVNSGVITAGAGNINIYSTLPSNINFNNTGGTLSALNGDINVRDAAFTGKYNFNLLGGDVLSKNLNIWSGNGNVDVNVKNVTGLLNATAANIHLTANAPEMRLGNILYTEDPTFYNLGGGISITSALNSGSTGGVAPGVAIVASGDITSNITGTVIDTAIGANPNGAVVLTIIAGANFTVTTTNPITGVTSGVLSPPGNPVDTLTLLGPSSTGGKIDFGTGGNISTAAAGGNNPAGPLTLAAFSGTGAASGSIRVGNISTGAGSASQTNGNVTIIAGAKSDPSGTQSAITVGNITTDSGAGALQGAVTLITGNPEVTGGQFQIVNGTVVGLNTSIPSASLGTSSVNPGASIATGNISTNVAPIMLVAGSNVNLNGTLSTNGVLANSGTGNGPGGNVMVAAGANITGTVSSISTKGIAGSSTVASNAGGDVFLIAGANSKVNLTHTFTNSSAALPAQNIDQVNTSLTITGPSASGGNVNLTGLAAVNTSAGPTQTFAPVQNNVSGGDLSIVAFSSSTNPSTTGKVTLQAGTATLINTGGSLPNQLAFTGDTNGTNVITISTTTVALQTAIQDGVVITGAGLPGGTTIQSFTPFTAPASTTLTLTQTAPLTLSGASLSLGTPQVGTTNVNGDVTIIAGAAAGTGTSSITLGSSANAISVDTSGGNEGGGNITIVTANATGGLPFSYGYNVKNPVPATQNGSLAPSLQLQQADVIINGSLNAVGGNFQLGSNETTLKTDISIKAGGNLTTGTISNANNTLPAGGPPAGIPSSSIRLEAGAMMNITGPISSNVGAASKGTVGADGGTVVLKAANYAFPNGQQKVSADGTGGYVLTSIPLNFTGTLNATNTVTNVFTTVDGTGLVVGTPITDNAGNTIIPAGTTLQQITAQGTQANAVLTAASNVVDVVTTGLVVGTQVAGGSIPIGSTVQSVNSPSVTFTGDVAIGTNNIQNVSDTTGLNPGTSIVGPGIPAGSVIDQIVVAGPGGTVSVTVPGGGTLNGTFSGVTFAQAGQVTLQNTLNGNNFSGVVAGSIVLVAANGTIQLNQATIGSGAGVAITNNLPTGQNGGNGGNISITTTAANPLSIGTSAFFVSALGDTTGGNGGVVSLTSGSSMSILPANLTAQPSLNPLNNAGFNTLIITGAGPIFNFTAASTLFINGSLNANGAPSTLSGNTGFPGGNGGLINITVNSPTPFNVGGAVASGNGVLTGSTLAANGNLGTVSGYGSGGTINIVNKGVGTATAPSGIIIASGALQVQAAAATDSTNLGAAQQTYFGGDGGNIILKGQAVQSLGGLDASGGALSAIRGSGNGGTIRIETNYTSTTNPAFTVDPTASATTTLNGVIGTLSAKGNSVPAVAPTITQGTIVSTQPSGNGGSIILKNTGGGIKIGSTASMSVAASNASSLQGTLGGAGGTIDLSASTTVQSAIGFNVNGGSESAPAATSITGTINNGEDVAIPIPNGTTGLFVGQQITLQQSLGGAAEGVLIKSIDSPTQITVWQVVAAPGGGYVNPSIQTYFQSGDGGRITISTNSASNLTVNNGSSSGNFVNGTLSATGFNGGTIEVTNKGTGGITVGASGLSTTAISPSNIVGATLVGVAGFGGNLSLQATGTSSEVIILGTANSVALSVAGATIAAGQSAGPNNGGIGGNINIVSNSTTPFVVNAASGTKNGVVGGLNANGGSGVGASNNAGTVTIVNLGGGITVSGPGVNVGSKTFSSISVMPGVLSDGSFGSAGTPGNGGALTLTAPAANSAVFIAGSQGVNMSGSTNHASVFADGLGGSLTITSNSTTAFNVGAGATNGIAGPVSANGWAGGSVSITNNGSGGIIVNSGSGLTVTPNNANADAVGSGGIQLAGGPGGNISLLAPKGIVAINGGLSVDGGAQAAGEVNVTDPYFLQGGNGGQIVILTGSGSFNVGGATAGSNGSTGALTARGATGGIINITALAGADIVVPAAAGLDVTGYSGVTCTQCNNTLPAGNPPTDLLVPGGNSGKIYLQATGTGGNVSIAAAASTGGLLAAGGGVGPGSSITCTACAAGPHAGNGGTIIIVSNSTTAFNIGNAAANTNGLGTGGSKLDASGYNGGTIGIENLGTGGISFNPSLIHVSSALGAVATASDVPGGNGGVIDLQAPKGKLGANTAGALNAFGTASTVKMDPQLTASGGIISLSALQIDTTVANLTLNAQGAKTVGSLGKGGTVILSQSTSTAAQALTVGSSKLLINVNGSPAANLGGIIAIKSPAGINIQGNIATDTGTTGTVSLDTAVGGKGIVTEKAGTCIITGTLNLLLADGGTGSAGVITNITDLNVRSSGPVTVNNTIQGDLTIGSALMTRAVDLSVIASAGDLNVGTISTPGTLSLSAVGNAQVLDSGNLTITGAVSAGTTTLSALSGDGFTGGLLSTSGAGIVSAPSITISPGISGATLKTSTGNLTIQSSLDLIVDINNTGNLLLNMGGSTALVILNVNNAGSITTVGPMDMVEILTLNNVDGTSFFGTTVAGSTVLNTGSVNSLVPGAPLQGIGIPAGTKVGQLVNSVGFTGSVEAGSDIVNTIGINGGPGLLGPGALVSNALSSSTDISPDTVISKVVVNGFPFTGDTALGSNTISNVNTVNGLQPGVAIVGTGIPVGATVATVGTNSITFNAPGGATANGTTVSIVQQPYLQLSAPANNTNASTSLIQEPFAIMTNAASVTGPIGSTFRQLNGSASSNTNSITLGGSVGANNALAFVEINAGGSIVQTSGVIAANNILLTSLNGNVGALNRTFTNNIYTPTGSALNVSLAPGLSNQAGTLAVITSNAFDNSSAGTINIAVNSGSANLNFIQAGGDAMIRTTNLDSAGTLDVTGPATSTYGALTILNTNSSPASTTGTINISANMTASGGPLVIQNNNSGASSAGSINLLSSAATPLTLSGVGWLLNGLGNTNVVNSASTSSTSVVGQQAGVSLVTGTSSGAYPAPPLTNDGTPPNVTPNTPGSSIITFGATGSVSSNTPNTIVNATGASVVFQGANSAINLGDSGTINAPSSALVISTLDLSNAAQVANLTTLAGTANSGITGTITTTTGNLTFDPTTTGLVMPLSLSNLSSMNVLAGQTLNFNNFNKTNPIAVNVATGTKNASIAGTVNFNAKTGTTPNSFSSDGRMTFNSNVVGQVLTVGGKINSDNNLLISAGGAVTLTGSLSSGANGLLGLFTGGANQAATTFAATTAPAGTLTLTGGDLIAGQSGQITICAASIVGTSTASLTGAAVDLVIDGSNWSPTGSLQIAQSKVSGITTISTAAMSIKSASGANINLSNTAKTGSVGALALDTLNSSVTFSQGPGLVVSTRGIDFAGSLSAGTQILTTASKNLVLGTEVSGIGIPVGTVILDLSPSVTFQGDIGANSNVINNVPDTTPLVVGAQVTGPGVPFGTVISSTAPAGVGIVQVTLSQNTTFPVAGTIELKQSAFALLSNPASVSVTNAPLKNSANPTTYGVLSLAATSNTGIISTGNNVSCGTCTFNTAVLTNLNVISTNSPAGKISVFSPSTAALTVIQTDGIRSGSMAATDGLTISEASTLTINGGSFSTLRGNLSVTQSATGDLIISNAAFSAGSFNGVPLGPTLALTDVLSTGAIVVNEVGTGSVTVTESFFNAIGGNVDLLSAGGGSVSLQGVLQADGGNVRVLNSGSTTITNSVLNANAIGSAATNALGGIVELNAGTNVSVANSLTTVPGTVPQYPLYNQPVGLVQPLGSNIAIDNNAGGTSPFPTGAIVQNVTGTTATLNLGNSPTAQTSLNLFGGGVILNLAGANSLLGSGNVISVNGFSPLAASTGAGNTLDIEMDDPEFKQQHAIAHVFAAGHKQAMMLTTHGFAEAANAKFDTSNKTSEFTLRSGELFLNPLTQTTIHTELADIKAGKGALLAVCADENGVRITACSGPGHVAVLVGEKAIKLSVGEELILSTRELSGDEVLKADGIGRRNFNSQKISSKLHASICEVSLLTVLSNWEHLASAKSSNNPLARSISDRMLKAGAVLSMVTQSRGTAYQAKARKAQLNSDETFIPVKFSSEARIRLRASAQ